MKNANIKKMSQISLVLFVIMIIINTLGAQGFINNLSQSDVSMMFPTLITPAGFTFSIWWVIYTLLCITLVASLIRYKNSYYEKIISSVSVLFWVSCFLNIAWIVAFSYKIIWLSAILIVWMFVTLFQIIKKVQTLNGNKKWLFDLSFGLYSWWLAIASVVNFVAYLVSIGFNFWGQEQMFYIVLLLIFLVVASALQFIHRNPFFNLSIAWAFFGIIAKHNFDNYSDPLFLILVIGIVILLALSIREMLKMRIKML